jgi:hypothetical protein
MEQLGTAGAGLGTTRGGRTIGTTRSTGTTRNNGFLGVWVAGRVSTRNN